jgi:hypothetical protein
MVNNVDLGSFNFKKGVFCEAPTKNMFQKWNTTILNDTKPYFMHNSQFIWMEKVL